MLKPKDVLGKASLAKIYKSLMIYALAKKKPNIAEGVFIAPDATIIGDVSIGKNSSVWFQSTLRGDVYPISIGENTNIQDNCVIHVTAGKFATKIGDNVSIAHGCIVHGATLHNHAFLGMGCTVLDGAQVLPYGLVAAGALVPQGFTVPAGTLVAGIPAKVIRPIKPEEREMILRIPNSYAENAKLYKTQLKQIFP